MDDIIHKVLIKSTGAVRPHTVCESKLFIYRYKTLNFLYYVFMFLQIEQA